MRTSRSFFGPHQYPPKDFAAYGIVVFPARASESTRQRHLDACNAYVATLPVPSELFVPESEQMVTVWPVEDAELAAALTDRRDSGVCELGVGRYHLATALIALQHAEIARQQHLDSRGPYLLAWSPSSEKGKHDALVLLADLSSVSGYGGFEYYFRRWRSDIEQSPELWEKGWSVSLFRARIRDFLDRWGPVILTLERS